VGKTLKDKIPAFTGLSNYTVNDLKQLGAGLASSGMASMFHYDNQFEGKEVTETMSIEKKDLDGTIESLSTATDVPELVFTGCPHCSLNEIKRAAQLIDGRRVMPGTELWACSSEYVRESARARQPKRRVSMFYVTPAPLSRR